MSVQAQSQSERELAEALRRRGHRVTSQRLVIHRALRDLDRHVTAEEVMAKVARQLPNVSLPTIYATLELFEELGIVRRAAVREGAALFDPRTDEHHHLVCRRCGRVEDLDTELDLARVRRAARRRGFNSDHAELVLSGLCSNCSSVN
jgi:Fur family ferric uptake transcriptional regulator/Fur family peroxide stress response transcriptional regulator